MRWLTCTEGFTDDDAVSRQVVMLSACAAAKAKALLSPV